MTELKAVHLCCGAGGITLGFKQAGIRTAYAFDIDPVAVETHRANFPAARVAIQDICEVRAANLPWADVWTCGIPCAPFSIAGKRLGAMDERDISGEIARLILESGPMPTFIFLENVPPYAGSVGAEQIRVALLGEGFCYLEAIFAHADYGVCQRRRRWHLIASRVPPVPFPEPTHCEGIDLWELPLWVRFGEIREGKLRDPRWMSARALKGIIRRQRRKTQVGIDRNCGVHAALYVVEDGDMMYTMMASAYKGISRNQAVVVAEGVGFREPTELEWRRAQGFPDDFKFAGNRRQRYEQMGRAVPPPFAEAVGRAIVEAAA